jgi:hypothetical protein
VAGRGSGRWPPRLRWMVSKIYHIGGLHAGAAPPVPPKDLKQRIIRTIHCFTLFVNAVAWRWGRLGRGRAGSGARPSLSTGPAIRAASAEKKKRLYRVLAEVVGRPTLPIYCSFERDVLK